MLPAASGFLTMRLLSVTRYICPIGCRGDIREAAFYALHDNLKGLCGNIFTACSGHIPKQV